MHGSRGEGPGDGNELGLHSAVSLPAPLAWPRLTLRRNAKWRAGLWGTCTTAAAQYGTHLELFRPSSLPCIWAAQSAAVR